MSEKEMLDQLKDIIHDRRSFLSGDKECDAIFQKDIAAISKVIKDYIILRNASLRSMRTKGENKTIWINENINSRFVDIIDIWKTDYDDIRCNAILYHESIKLANVIVSYDEDTLMHIGDNQNIQKTQKFFNNAFKTLIYDNFNQYLKLPRLSRCTKLLQEIYDNVNRSEATMCHITEEDWIEDYSDRFNDNDLKKLKEEVEKYGLQDVITFNDSEYKVLGYGDLETRFNDDRDFIKKREELDR